MKKYTILIIGAFAIIFFGCERKDYLIDGGIHNPKVDMTTYDYLKTKRVLDTLLLLIDKAGLKETINGDVTFFAPTDFSVVNYVATKKADIQAINPFSNFTLESIPAETLRDSLKMYMIPGKINRDDMTAEGKTYTTLMGNKVHIALVPVQDAYTNIVTTWPQYVFFTKINGAGLDVPGTVPPAAELDVKNVCQTSGIITNTGILHVIENSHTMFYFVQTHFPD